MSALDDARTLIQDIVVPDLKALSARVDALDASVKQRFDAAEKLSEARHELVLVRMQTGFAATDARFAALLAATDAKFAALLAAMDAKFAAMDARLDALQKALNTDRRLELLEAAQAKVQ